MSIAAESEKGAIRAKIGEREYTLLLRIGEIERWEAKHPTGIFDMWDALHAEGRQPTSTEVRDLVALGLVGGGLSNLEADKAIERSGAIEILALRHIAQALLGAALIPGLDEVIDSDGTLVKKKSVDSGLPKSLEPVRQPDTGQPRSEQ